MTRWICVHCGKSNNLRERCWYCNEMKTESIRPGDYVQTPKGIGQVVEIKADGVIVKMDRFWGHLVMFPKEAITPCKEVEK